MRVCSQFQAGWLDKGAYLAFALPLSDFRLRAGGVSTAEDLEALSPNDHLHGEVDSRLISFHETVDLLIGRLAFGFFEFNPQL